MNENYRDQGDALLVPFSRPYYWANGIVNDICVLLVEVHTDAGIGGIGECVGSPVPSAINVYLRQAAARCVGRDPFENARLMADGRNELFRSFGTGSAPRFADQILAGLEMVLRDVMGKAVNRPVHELLGGAVREEVRYFGFAQGQGAAEVAADAHRLAEEGFEVIYFPLAGSAVPQWANCRARSPLVGVRRMSCLTTDKRLALPPL